MLPTGKADSMLPERTTNERMPARILLREVIIVKIESKRIIKSKIFKLSFAICISLLLVAGEPGHSA